MVTGCSLLTPGPRSGCTEPFGRLPHDPRRGRARARAGMEKEVRDSALEIAHRMLGLGRDGR